MSRENLIIEELRRKVADLEAQLAAAQNQPELVPTIEPNALYTAGQVRERLNCGLTNVYDLMDSGQLAHINIGAGKKGKRVRGADIHVFLESRKEGGPTLTMNFKYLKMG